MSKKLIINLTKQNRAREYDNDDTVTELFQYEAMDKIVNILKNEANYIEDLDPHANISDLRVHNAILVDGERGAGKTAFLLNIENDLKNKEEKKDNNKFFSIKTY